MNDVWPLNINNMYIYIYIDFRFIYIYIVEVLSNNFGVAARAGKKALLGRGRWREINRSYILSSFDLRLRRKAWAFKRQLASLLYHDICDLCFSWQYNFDRLLMQLPSPKKSTCWPTYGNLRGIRLATSRLPLSSLSVAETPYHRTNALNPIPFTKSQDIGPCIPLQISWKKDQMNPIFLSRLQYIAARHQMWCSKLRQWKHRKKKSYPGPGIINTSSNVPYEETFQLIGSCFTQLKVQIFGPPWISSWMLRLHCKHSHMGKPF